MSSLMVASKKAQAQNTAREVKVEGNLSRKRNSAGLDHPRSVKGDCQELNLFIVKKVNKDVSGSAQDKQKGQEMLIYHPLLHHLPPLEAESQSHKILMH